jgi:diaminohydroxyphosphoribosylaminopyrimidine deaminase / 5-amino-6-(5-phosphoribosylamino)uracil reductase
LRRACELAARGKGSTSPNPSVGAIFVRDGVTLGEGFHRKHGSAHAESEALAAAGSARDATLYVTLEPCDHHGATPPCSQALVQAGVARVVIGALDPHPRTAGKGVARLRASGIAVEVAGDPCALELIEDFSVSSRERRPYLRLKLAASLDGYVAPAPGSHWLTGEAARSYVRELRATHDAVLVGAGTVRVDDPQLTVRPLHARRLPYRRVVACEDAPVEPSRKIFAPVEGYGPTIVLAPSGLRERFAALDGIAELVFVGDDDAQTLDLAAALHSLRRLGIASVLCEGGPTLAARLLERSLVDRVDWLVAPQLLANSRAVPALAGNVSGGSALRLDRIERLGDDVLVSLRAAEEDRCLVA